MWTDNKGMNKYVEIASKDIDWALQFCKAWWKASEANKHKTYRRMQSTLVVEFVCHLKWMMR